MGLLSLWFDSRNRGTVAGLAAVGGGVSFVVVGALVPLLTGRDSEDGWRHTWYVLGVVVMAAGLLSLVFLRDRPVAGTGRGKSRAAWPLEAYKSRLVWLITFLAFCSGWATGLYTTFFGAYLEDQGVGLGVIGRLWGLLGLLGIGSGVLWGHLSDRMSRRWGFLLSFVTLAVGYTVFWVTPAMGGFVASVVLVGLSFRGAYTICAASAGDYVAPVLSAAAFGLMAVGAGLGQAIGALVGGRGGRPGWAGVGLRAGYGGGSSGRRGSLFSPAPVHQIAGLSRFNGTPHLATPVMLDLAAAIAEIQRICHRLDLRYKSLESSGVKEPGRAQR